MGAGAVWSVTRVPDAGTPCSGGPVTAWGVTTAPVASCSAARSPTWACHALWMAEPHSKSVPWVRVPPVPSIQELPC